MAYELKLQADTITELADKVRSHYHELESIVNVPANLTDATAAVINQNFAAARSEPLVSKEEMESLHSKEDVTGQVDKDGLPWDGRIHSSNKKMTAKGVWSRRKNVDDAFFQQIAAELKAASANIVQPAPVAYTPPPAVSNQFQQPAPFTPPYTPPAPQTVIPHIPMQIAPIAPQNQYADIPAYMAAAPTAPVQPVVPAPQPQTYGIQDLFNKIQPMFAQNLEQAQAYVNSLTQRLSTQFQMQVQSVNDIAGRPDMIAYAMQLIATDGK